MSAVISFEKEEKEMDEIKVGNCRNIMYNLLL